MNYKALYEKQKELLHIYKAYFSCLQKVDKEDVTQLESELSALESEEHEQPIAQRVNKPESSADIKAVDLIKSWEVENFILNHKHNQYLNFSKDQPDKFYMIVQMLNEFASQRVEREVTDEEIESYFNQSPDNPIHPDRYRTEGARWMRNELTKEK